MKKEPVEGRDQFLAVAVGAGEGEYKRKDTSELQARIELVALAMLQDDEIWANHPDAVRLPSGELRLRHKEKLETPLERERRLEHNSYMRMSRSFSSVLLELVGKLAAMRCSDAAGGLGTSAAPQAQKLDLIGEFTRLD